jgi:hypothetical protein
MDLQWPFFKHSNVLSPYNPKLYVFQITFGDLRFQHTWKFCCASFSMGFDAHLLFAYYCVCVFWAWIHVYCNWINLLGLVAIQGSIMSFGFCVCTWTTMVIGVHMVMHNKYPLNLSPQVSIINFTHKGNTLHKKN